MVVISLHLKELHRPCSILTVLCIVQHPSQMRFFFPHEDVLMLQPEFIASLWETPPARRFFHFY